jgi:hypothetical protein
MIKEISGRQTVSFMFALYFGLSLTSLPAFFVMNAGTGELQLSPNSARRSLLNSGFEG